MTLVIGRRVHELRGREMSQAELGERMTALGCGRWGRTSVQKLETGRRGAVSVQELLALAQVFEVSPVMLLSDPRHVDVVPAGPGNDLDGWSALFWLIGLGRPAPAAFGHVDHFLRAALQFAAAVSDIPPGAGPPGRVETQEARRRETFIAATLEQIRDALLAFRDTWQVPLPPVPPHVMSVARHYDVDLMQER